MYSIIFHSLLVNPNNGTSFVTTLFHSISLHHRYKHTLKEKHDENEVKVVHSFMEVNKCANALVNIFID